MFFTVLDLILLLILFIFVSFSFWLGLIQTLGGLVGLFVGVWISGMYYESFGAWLQPYILDNENVAKVVAFIVIFTIVNRLVGLVFYILNKIFNIISIIPFLKSINRVAGAVFGLVEGVLIIGAILLVVRSFPFSEWLTNLVEDSQVAFWLLNVADTILGPLLPKILIGIETIT